MRTLCLILLGVVVGWAASGVDWTRDAVGQEGPILTENLAPPEAVAAGAIVETEPMEMQPFFAPLPGRYQIHADAGGCYRVDTATGKVWHITLHMKPRIVASAAEGEGAR
jgi:hypothetical protein